MNAIILQSGKQLNKPKATQGEEGECVVKEKGKLSMEKEVDVVSKDKEQDKHKEVLRPRVVGPY